MKQHNFKVVALKDLVSYPLKDYDSDNTMVIQILHKGPNKNRLKRLQYGELKTFIFNDEDEGQKGFLTDDVAREIVKLGKKLARTKKKYNIIVSCYAGLSRSPATAMALLGVIFNETKDIRYGIKGTELLDKYPHYNKDVFNKVKRIYEQG